MVMTCTYPRNPSNVHDAFLQADARHKFIDPRIGVVNNSGKAKVVTVALALGSNLGDSFRNIELALRYLENPHLLDVDDDEVIASIQSAAASAKDQGRCSDALVTIVNTSFLYETAPMYVKDQPRFVNGACLVRRIISLLST